MDYQKIYNQLIDKAKNRELISPAEKHHIIPKSMGGDNRKSNIVHITPREHFVAHLLLWKIYRNQSMSYAIWQMSHTRGIRINGRMYASLRKDISINVSKQMSGKIVSDETKEKMSNSGTGRIFTQEHRDNIGKSSTGRKSAMKGRSFNLSEEEIKRRSNSRKGKNLGNPGFIGNHKEESIQKMKDNKKGHKPTNFKPVEVNGAIFESAADASRKLNLTYNMIIGRIRSDKHPGYFYSNSLC